MTTIKYNDIVKELLEMEGGPVQVNVAQCRELLSKLCVILSRWDYMEQGTFIDQTAERYKKAQQRKAGKVKP